MLTDFLGSAYPWIILGLSMALSCSWLSHRNKK